jgi:two-component system, LytTR family, response regulator
MKNPILSAVIIDDEVAAIGVLTELLKPFTSIKIVATASNIEDGVEFIKRTQPDIVFLNINLPGRKMMEINNEFKSPHFKIMFCFDYHQYEINALDKSKAGFLLKPIEIIDLEELLQKVTMDIVNEQKQRQIHETVNIMSTPEIVGENIILDVDHGFIVENSHNIVYCYAKNSYSVIVLNTDKEWLVPKSLKELQDILPKNQFYRTHKSYLVNIYYIQKFVRGKENYVCLEGDVKIPVSVRVTSVISKDIRKKLTV